MALSNYTSTLLLKGQISPVQIADPVMVLVFGWIMLMASLLGMSVNCCVLRNFYKQKMSSFDILCSSKTLSNMCILLGYVIHNAPITIIGNFNGPTLMNILVNQMVNYGIYIVGPIVQFMISINRLMVIIFVKQSMTQNNQKLTIIVLVTFWLIGIILTVATINSCDVIYNPEILNWWSGGCDENLGDTITGFVILCAVLSNLCNLVIVVKLVLAINKNQLDSSTVRRRKQKSRKLFIQSCIQDWLFAIDSINSTFVDLISDDAIFTFFCDIFSNMMTPVLDGIVMLIFNHESKIKKSRIMSVKKREATPQNTGSQSRY
ncbi:7TM GPCR serpentine receptor class x (Srx) domain-containing protein [Caenorhabditis elegans]|uniref:7TM GPCR serpentine receptor class x (Srx) domain-containing protein n=1 Tax=Caenorhabditis elegans TaxID=6239 RepID=O17089_CAEEL|nr:7TM GPCR serpentine receptor class x (Srx) domain-containing protein [Caenorhabditis elegans]CCD67492.1 7TM GPCR serpentine receptor class x (Srx) domain-containing protein [Caenorhabditis elegans]|eukprot:NP_494615.2 Serpentine Receptor, class X [Caenorhabditis elegans]